SGAIIGDVNNDKKVNSTDLALLKKSILGQVQINFTLADLNSDGKFNSTDYVILKRLILNPTR
ncbi:MAG TPA: dockerin type I repeat-containing protein, partial [Clostridia bacterium]